MDEKPKSALSVYTAGALDSTFTVDVPIATIGKVVFGVVIAAALIALIKHLATN